MEKREYKVTVLEERALFSSELLSGAHNDDIVKRMKEIIAVEGPIRESLLYKRVLNSYSLYKNGSLLNDLLLSLTASFDNTTMDENGERVYHTGKDESYFRPTPDSSVRYSYQIPYVEGANAILYILENGNKSSYTKSELLRLFISQMGYQKNGDKIEELFSYALQDPRIRKSGNGRIVKG